MDVIFIILGGIVAYVIVAALVNVYIKKFAAPGSFDGEMVPELTSFFWVITLFAIIPISAYDIIMQLFGEDTLMFDFMKRKK